GQGLSRNACALRAETPDRLRTLVDRDERRECLRSPPPAELRAGNDPFVLVEPVPDVCVRQLRMRVEPGGERASTIRQRHLVQWLLLRARDDERRRSHLRILRGGRCGRGGGLRRGGSLLLCRGGRLHSGRRLGGGGQRLGPEIGALHDGRCVRRYVFRLSDLLVLGVSSERDDDERGAGVEELRAGGGGLRDDGVGGEAVYRAGDPPGETDVLESALREDERLVADVRDDDRLRERRGRRRGTRRGAEIAPGGVRETGGRGQRHQHDYG